MAPTIDQIRATLHVLLEREIETRILHDQDNARLGRFDLDSPHLRTLLGIGGAIDGVKAAWIAARKGDDPIRALSLYSNRYFPSPGANEGIPEACDEISAIVREWRGNGDD